MRATIARDVIQAHGSRPVRSTIDLRNRYCNGVPAMVDMIWRDFEQLAHCGLRA
jgi:hypothetical protein